MNQSHIYHWFILKELLSNITGAHYPLEIIALIITNNYKPIKIYCGSRHTILSKEDMYVWGSNVNRQLGLDAYVSYYSPQKSTPNKKLDKIQSIHCGRDYTIILTKIGTSYAWSDGKKSLHLELLHRIGCDTLQEFSPLNILSISCGKHHTIILVRSDESTSQEIKCYGWGYNYSGQIGSGYVNWMTKYMPREINLSNVSSISCGYSHTIALTNENEIYSWGSNDNGRLGLGDTISKYSPQKINLTNIMSVSCGINFTIALTINGKLYSWGNNKWGQLGLGNYCDQHLPQYISLPESIGSVVCGRNHTFALTNNGNIYGWGYNNFGQVGLTEYFNINRPQKLYFLEPIKSISCGSNHTIAVTNNDMLYVWGKNNYGQLGLGDSTNRFTPTKLEF